MLDTPRRSDLGRVLAKSRRRADRRRSASLRPLVEALEARLVLSTINWNTPASPSGGDWDVATNWVGGVIPKAADNAVINLTSSGVVTHSTNASDAVATLTDNASTQVSLTAGSIAIGGGTSTINNTFTVSAAGTLQLSGTTLNGAGTLADGSTGSVVVTGSSTVATLTTAAGSSLQVLANGGVGGVTLVVANSFTNSGTIDLTSVTSGYTATLTVGASGVGTLTNAPGGLITSSVGAGGPRGLHATLVNQAGGTLTANQALTVAVVATGAASNAGTINANAATTFILAPTASLTNTGTFNLASGNTLAVSGGSLTNFSSGTLTGGTYNISGTFQFPNANIATNAASITLNGTASKIIDTSSTPLDALRGFATNAAAGSFSIQGGRNFTTSGPFSNAGSVTVGPSLTFTATGAYTQSGGSTNLVNGGTLTSTTKVVTINGGLLGGSGVVNGNVVSGGQVVPGGVGAAGILSILGNYTQGSGASTTVNLGGPNLGTGYSQLNVTGQANLAGTLYVDLINGFAPGNNATFQVLNYNPDNGQFAIVNPQNFPAGTSVGTSYMPASLFLITNVAPVLTSIAITPSSPTLAFGVTEAFTAIGTYSDNSTANLTNLVTWASANTSIATISNTPPNQGVATGLAPGTSTITATSGSVTSSTTLTVVATLAVPSFAPTSTGFTAAFNEPFSLAPLNLYTTAAANLGPADVTVVGASTGPVAGSLVVAPGNQAITFLKTGGVLAPDTYTVTFRSATNGFTDTSGGLLDGNGDGTTGDDYTTTFTVAPSSAVIVAVPDFARGPGQSVVIPAATGSGLPLTISDGTNVTSISLTLTYDPTLLTITGANLGSAAPAGSSVSVDTSTPGLALLTFTSPTALPAGLDTFATLVASVPNAAPYASKEALVLSGISLNGGSIAGTDGDGVHVVAYLGDTTGNGGYSSFDATLVRQVVANISTGFAAYPLLDPRIVGDIAGFGTLSGIDATYITQYVANIPQPRIPALPGVTIVAGGPDPLIWLPQDLTASPGSTLTVPVDFRQTNGSAIGLDSANLAIEFDPGLFVVTGVRLGDLTGGFTLAESFDNATGEVIASERSASGAIELAPGTQGALLYVDLMVRPGADLGSARINLLGEGRVGSAVVYTSLNDGGLTLIPAPSDSDLDPTDGVVTVVAATTSQPTTTTMVAVAPGTVVGPPGLVAAGPPAAIDRAIEASHGAGPLAGRAGAPRANDTSSSVDEIVGELIPWASPDPSAGSEDLVIARSPKKAGGGRVLLALATPDGVGPRR